MRCDVEHVHSAVRFLKKNYKAIEMERSHPYGRAKWKSWRVKLIERFSRTQTYGITSRVTTPSTRSGARVLSAAVFADEVHRGRAECEICKLPRGQELRGVGAQGRNRTADTRIFS